MTGPSAAILLTLAAIAQPLAGMLAPVFGIGLSPAERAMADGIPPELPPGPFFSIWAVIFTLMAVCAGLAWRHVERADVGRAAYWLGLAGVGNIAWMVQNQLFGVILLDFTILLPTLACAALALRASLALGDGRGWWRTVWQAASGLLSGWLCVATAIALPRVLREGAGMGVSDAVWPLSWLTFLIALGAVLTVRRYGGRSLWTLAAAGWGLAGIIANTVTRTGTPLIGWTLAGAALIALALFRPRRQKPA